MALKPSDKCLIPHNPTHLIMFRLQGWGKKIDNTEATAIGLTLHVTEPWAGIPILLLSPASCQGTSFEFLALTWEAWFENLSFCFSLAQP